MPKPVPPPEPGKEVTFWTCGGREGKCRSMNRSIKQFCFRCGAPQAMAVPAREPPNKDPHAMAMADAAATSAFGGAGASAFDAPPPDDDGAGYTPPVAPEDDTVAEPPAADGGGGAAGDEYVPPIGDAPDGGAEGDGDLEEGEVVLDAAGGKQ